MSDSTSLPPVATVSCGESLRTAPIVIRRFGLEPYNPMRLAMRRFTADRSADSSDEIWLLQHPPVFTLGQAGRAEHLLEQRGIELIQTERGGQITYHGPGQVVAYVLLDLKRRNLKVREFVSLLEQALIATLRRYNVSGQTKPGAPGVYVEQNGDLKKIAALGLKIEKGCSYHGVSLNVDMDLAPFGWINPCGYAGLQTTDLAHLGQLARVDEVGPELADSIVAALNRHKESDD